MKENSMFVFTSEIPNLGDHRDKAILKTKFQKAIDDYFSKQKPKEKIKRDEPETL